MAARNTHTSSAPCRLRCDNGAATAETAIAMIAVSLLLALLLGAGSLMVAQVRMVDASRTVARELVRGESEGAARAAGAKVAGSDARIDVARDGDFVTVRTSRPVRLGGLLPPSLQISGEASGYVEPDLAHTQGGNHER